MLPERTSCDSGNFGRIYCRIIDIIGEGEQTDGQRDEQTCSMYQIVGRAPGCLG